MRISDWSSDVCSSDLSYLGQLLEFPIVSPDSSDAARAAQHSANPLHADDDEPVRIHAGRDIGTTARGLTLWLPKQARRSEEHTSELQSLMRISYAVFCLKKKNNKKNTKTLTPNNDYMHVKSATPLDTPRATASRQRTQ